jgi:NAD(P)-dependent dehydrogenase (short-subunit alcohol dehydrogenase family)
MQSPTAIDDAVAQEDAPARAVAVVTGGSGGIGRGVITALRDCGIRVVATAHRPPPDPVDGVAVETADLLDTEHIPHLVTRITEQHGPIDALVCVASGFAGGSFIQADHHTWREIVDLNLNSAATTIRAVMPGMIARGAGSIVTIAARPAFDPTPHGAAVAAAHTAVTAMTRSLARELQGTGVTVNCVLPDVVDTPLMRERYPDVDPSVWVTPEEIGGVVAFLCSPAGRVVRGASLPVARS